MKDEPMGARIDGDRLAVERWRARRSVDAHLDIGEIAEVGIARVDDDGGHRSREVRVPAGAVVADESRTCRDGTLGELATRGEQLAGGA